MNVKHGGFALFVSEMAMDLVGFDLAHKESDIEILREQLAHKLSLYRVPDNLFEMSENDDKGSWFERQIGSSLPFFLDPTEESLKQLMTYRQIWNFSFESESIIGLINGATESAIIPDVQVLDLLTGQDHGETMKIEDSDLGNMTSQRDWR